MDYEATAKYIRTSTRKLRLIADLIRHLKPADALIQLVHMPKDAAGPMAKVVSSAIANAMQKQIKADVLKFKQLKSWRSCDEAVSRSIARSGTFYKNA